MALTSIPRATRSGRYFNPPPSVAVHTPSCEHFWLTTFVTKLSNKRRVVVSKFKGSMFVNIREFYEDNSGDMKPGKKVRQAT